MQLKLFEIEISALFIYDSYRTISWSIVSKFIIKPTIYKNIFSGKFTNNPEDKSTYYFKKISKTTYKYIY